MVRSPCTLLWPRTGQAPGSGPAQIAAQQKKVDDLLNVGHGVLVLRQAHGPAAMMRSGADRNLGGRADLLAREALCSTISAQETWAERRHEIRGSPRCAAR